MAGQGDLEEINAGQSHEVSLRFLAMALLMEGASGIARLPHPVVQRGDGVFGIDPAIGV